MASKVPSFAFGNLVDIGLGKPAPKKPLSGSEKVAASAVRASALQYALNS